MGAYVHGCLYSLWVLIIPILQYDTMVCSSCTKYHIYPLLLIILLLSGVATLGHAGARAPATRGRAPATRGHAPPIVALLIANRALNGLEIERRSIAIHNTELRSSLIRSSYASFAVSDLHFATVYGLRTIDNVYGRQNRPGRL